MEIIIFFSNFRQSNPEVDCNKPTISYLYVVSGALAVGFAVVGLLMTIGGIYAAQVR
jgi:hypothetical protein